MSVSTGVAPAIAADRAGGLWIYGLLVLLCLALYLPGLTSLPPIDRDESRFAQATYQMLDSGDFVDIRFQDEPRHRKPIGIYWLQSLSVSLVGDTGAIWAYRLPSLLGAIITVLATAWIGRRLFGPWVGTVAAVILACATVLTVEARQARTDSMLLATIVLAQAALIHLWLARDRGGAGWTAPAVLWLATGAGILLKGPIILLVVGTTVAALAIVERRVDWLATLRPVTGLAVVLAVVSPWLIAITLATNGAFFEASVGGDLLGKVFDGQEGHGAPPGTYLILFWATFWPFSLPAVLAIPWVWHRRRDPAVRLCLAWILPTWLVFELVMTKLPHYVMPTYPAIALLTAAAVADGFGRAGAALARWRVWATWLGWMIPTLGLTAGIAALPAVMGLPLDYLAVLAAVIGLVLAAWSLHALLGARWQRALVALAALAAVSYPLALGRVFPMLEPLWLSPRIAAAVSEAEHCPNPAVAAVGYHEPSLVFLLGTETRLVDDGAAAARHLLDAPCGLALVGAAAEEAFRAELADAGGGAEVAAVVDGFNYNRGGDVVLTLFRPTPEAQ